MRRFLAQVLLILCLALVALELITRLVWWNRSAVTLFSRRLELLPYPVVTARQKQILTDVSKGAYRYTHFDPVLGWSITPNVSGEWDGSVYTSNSIGIRSLREYGPRAPAGVTRIAAFGPSFTHCDEVNDAETWQVRMEQARSDLEVMNWGVAGYGTDQALLRYQTRGAAYQPDIVLIGFEDHNWTRNINRYRPFEYRDTEIPLTKPVYVIAHEKLMLLPNPFETLDEMRQAVSGAPDDFLGAVCPWDGLCDERLYRWRSLDRSAAFRFLRTLALQIETDPGEPPINREYPQINAYQTTRALLEMFAAEVNRNHAIPIVVLFPLEATLVSSETPMYETVLIPALERMRIQAIDLRDAFVEARQSKQLAVEEFFARQGHPNTLGNEVVADALLRHLCNRGLVTDCRASQ